MPPRPFPFPTIGGAPGSLYLSFVRSTLRKVVRISGYEILSPQLPKFGFCFREAWGLEREFRDKERRRKLRNEPGLVAVPALILTELQMGSSQQLLLTHGYSVDILFR